MRIEQWQITVDRDKDVSEEDYEKIEMCLEDAVELLRQRLKNELGDGFEVRYR